MSSPLRPALLNPFEFTVVSALRAKQLIAGCTPRLAGNHSAPVMARMEVAAGCVSRAAVGDQNEPRQYGWQR